MKEFSYKTLRADTKKELASSTAELVLEGYEVLCEPRKVPYTIGEPCKFEVSLRKIS